MTLTNIIIEEITDHWKKFLCNFLINNISIAIGAPVKAANGQLINVESATVKTANSYFLMIQAPVDNKHIYLYRNVTVNTNLINVTNLNSIQKKTYMEKLEGKNAVLEINIPGLKSIKISTIFPTCIPNSFMTALNRKSFKCNSFI